jgi:hypothetical protein
LTKEKQNSAPKALSRTFKAPNGGGKLVAKRCLMHSSFARSFLLLLSILATGQTSPAIAQPKPLQGGVQDEAALKSSVHVVPPGGSKLPLTTGIEATRLEGSANRGLLQGGAGAGSAQGGASQPALQTGIPYQQYNGSHPVNQIAPSSTYTFTPHTNVMQFPGTYTYTPGTQFRGVMNYAGTPGTTQVQSGSTGGSGYGDRYTSSHGVTTSSGYTITRTTIDPGNIPIEPGASFSVYSRWAQTTKNGLSYAPGFEPKSEATEG